MKKMVKVLGLVMCLILIAASTIVAQEACEGNFDCDQDVDGTDASLFKTDFGRSQFKNPCPNCSENSPVPKTGQFTCYETNGSVRQCADTGEDGDYQKGVAWPNPRFTDNGDGTVTDNLTGLEWTKDAQQIAGAKDWQGALDACNNLVYANHGDWRLPNLRELQSLIDYSQNTPALPAGYPFVNVQSYYYRTSSTFVSDGSYGWIVHMGDGDMVYSYKSDPTNYFVWPVRGRNPL